MVAVIYASLSALWIVWLSLYAIKSRQKHRVLFGDGGNAELQAALGAHSNATHYIPIALILLFALEYNGAAVWLVHAFGVALLGGRVIHAHGLLAKKFRHRVVGMQVTLYTLIGLALVNMVYLPYRNVLPSWPSF